MKATWVIGAISSLLIFAASCQNGNSIEYERYYTAGSLVYQNHCQNCHGNHGEGLGTLIPPLTDSAFLRKNSHLLPCILNNGLKGKITVAKKDFDDQMPAVALSPMEIAEALTYVRNSFGNKLGLLPVETVTADLNKCK